MLKIEGQGGKFIVFSFFMSKLKKGNQDAFLFGCQVRQLHSHNPPCKAELPRTRPHFRSTFCGPSSFLCGSQRCVCVICVSYQSRLMEFLLTPAPAALAGAVTVTLEPGQSSLIIYNKLAQQATLKLKSFPMLFHIKSLLIDVLHVCYSYYLFFSNL